MPISVEELNRSQGVPMKEVFSNIGITKHELAIAAKQALNANITRTVKLKGFFDKRRKLPSGYKMVKGTLHETLIEHEQINWSTREDARKDIQRLLGLYPKESLSIENGFDPIIADVISNILEKSKGLPCLPSQEVDE